MFLPACCRECEEVAENALQRLDSFFDLVGAKWSTTLVTLEAVVIRVAYRPYRDEHHYEVAQFVGQFDLTNCPPPSECIEKVISDFENRVYDTIELDESEMTWGRKLSGPNQRAFLGFGNIFGLLNESRLSGLSPSDIGARKFDISKRRREGLLKQIRKHKAIINSPGEQASEQMSHLKKLTRDLLNRQNKWGSITFGRPGVFCWSKLNNKWWNPICSDLSI